MSTGAGRPPKPIDWDRVDELLEAGCSASEIAPHFNLHPDTFCDRVFTHHGVKFTEYAGKMFEKGNSMLREVQHKKAASGDNVMLVWLGKNRMKQRENPTESTVSKEIVDSFSAVMDQMNRMQKAIKEEMDQSV